MTKRKPYIIKAKDSARLSRKFREPRTLEQYSEYIRSASLLGGQAAVFQFKLRENVKVQALQQILDAAGYKTNIYQLNDKGPYHLSVEW